MDKSVLIPQRGNNFSTVSKISFKAQVQDQVQVQRILIQK